jgi:excisionase family DNA binding protein
MSQEPDEQETIFHPGPQVVRLREAYGASAEQFATLIQDAGDTIGVPNSCTRATVTAWERHSVRYIAHWFQPVLRHLDNNRPREANELTNDAAGHGAHTSEIDLDSLGFLTVAEVAERFRVSKMTIYRAIHDGDLSAVRIGRGFRIRAKAAHDFLEDNLVAPET